MWNMVGFRKSCNAVALFSLLSGCTTLTDCKYELGQKVRTKQAWHEFDGCNDRCFTLDYSCGWKQGYYDVLTGGDGRPPVVPPKKYWKPPVFTEHDPSRVNDWYTGYQDGAGCAKCQPDHHYVPTFLPGCAPSSHYSTEGSSVPAYFPMEHVSGRSLEVASPEIPPQSGALGNSGAATLNERSADGSGSPEIPPPATPPAAETYEADPDAAPEPKPPEPASTGIRGASHPLNQHVAVSRPSQSLLQQLVLNSVQGTDTGDSENLD